jgi:hypothetical protein
MPPVDTRVSLLEEEVNSLRTDVGRLRSVVGKMGTCLRLAWFVLVALAAALFGQWVFVA